MRHVAHVLLVVLLVLGTPSQWVPAFFGDATVPAQDDCCPDDGSGDEADCCDWDFGKCCAGAPSVLPDSPVATWEQGGAVIGRLAPLPAHLLQTRANGPPPTPPPIA